jgi:SNF2 family DNA or RNA helicase
MEMKLWNHQIECIEKAKAFDYFALFMEPGVGKTATTISIIRNLYSKNNKVLPTIILAPPVVISNWRNEILLFSKIKRDSIKLLVGTGKERAEIVRTSPLNSIFVTNYETLLMKEVLAEFKKVLMSDQSVLVLDESHKCKDHTSKRTKYAIELADIATYRYILTGTPILRNLMDIWAQFRILDRGARFGSNFWTFRARFFEDKNKAMPKQKYFPDWQPMKGADRRIKELMEPVSMHVEKSKCLSLPPLVKKTIFVEMSKEQQRLYDAMKRDLVATITTGDGQQRHSIAELAITKALRLQQIVSGHLRIEGVDGGDTGTIKIKENPRREALKDLLGDLAPYHKVLVWAVFKDNYEDIRSVCGDLGLRYVELHGETKDREKSVRDFETDDTVRVLIGHPGSGGIGVNLVSASYSIFYTRSFSLEFDIQAEARNYRGGSERHTSITRIDLVTPGTIDELVMKSLATKQELSDKILKEKMGEI